MAYRLLTMDNWRTVVRGRLPYNLTKTENNMGTGTRYSKEQIIQVCELLSSSENYSVDDIAQMTGVSPSTVRDVYYRNSHVEESKNYKFYRRIRKYTTANIKEVCQLLQDNTDLTYDEISQMTGVTRGMIISIQRGIAHQEISRNYNLDYRTSWRHGEKHISAKHTNEQIVEVCKLLSDPKYSFNQISQMTNVKIGTVRSVYYHRTWECIAKDYDFPIRSYSCNGVDNFAKRYTEKQVIRVCKDLMNPDLTFSQIAKRNHVKESAVASIYEHRSWKMVSRDYKFPKRNKGRKEKPWR